MELFKGILYRKNYIYIFINLLKNNIISLPLNLNGFLKIKF